MAPSKQLLEINLISAQDLEPVSKKMRTYATAWMHENRKLTSSVDTEGKNNPTWNDKFVFKVDEEFLRKDTSAVMIEIYAEHWFRHVLVGTVRVLVGNLIPTPTRSHHHTGMRFVALQVRRSSGRPQGILNIGVALLDSSMKSMPLYRQLSMSAVGIRDLLEDPPTLQHHNDYENNYGMKPILRRSKSDRSEMVGTEDFSPRSSMVAVKVKPEAKESSIISISECVVPYKAMKKMGKASSVINGAELLEKPRLRVKKGKASSVVNDSIMIKPAIHELGKGVETKNKKVNENTKVDEKSPIKPKLVHNEKLPVATIGKPVQKYDLGPSKVPLAKGKFALNIPAKKGNSVWSDSEVGPSPSEVAAAMAERKYPLEDNQSSVLDGWSVDESVEGLKSKLERWRMELPPLYDRGGFSSSDNTSYKSSAGRGHARRHTTDSGSGMFSCFGNIFGYECQCICGKPPGNNRSLSARYSPSTLTPGRSFL